MSGTVDTSLLTVGGFQRKVNKNLPGSKNMREAYEKTEEEHRDSFGFRKYSGYDSFRVIRWRYVRKRRR